MYRSIYRLFVFSGLAAMLTGAAACGDVVSAADAGLPDADTPPDVALPDAPLPDASPPDAPPPPSFDVAYINEFTFNNNIGSVSSFGLVIATGNEPLDLATTEIVSMSDDHPTADVTFSLFNNNGQVLQPGQAAGSLSPLATQLIINSGLVTEPVATNNYSFSLSFQNLPANTTFNLNAQATLRINGNEIVMPMTVHIIPGANTAFNNASRITTPNR